MMACGEGLEHFLASYDKIHWYLMLFVCISGVVGNLINMAVFTHRKMRAPIDAIFTALAISHLLVLLTIIPNILHVSQESYYYLLYKLGSRNVEWVGEFIATWLTLTLVVWGLIKVAFEQKTYLCTMRRAIAASLAPFLICPIVCIPAFLTYEISTKYAILDEDGGDTIYYEDFEELDLSNATMTHHHGLSEIGKANDYILVEINSWIYGVIFVIGPCIALAILTACLIYTSKKRKYQNIPTALVTLGVYESNEEDELASIQSNRTIDTPTNLLIALSVVFIVLNLPLGILNMLVFCLDYRFVQCLIKLRQFIHMITFIYPCITFILYCKMREGFWDTMVFIVKPKCLNRW